MNDCFRNFAQLHLESGHSLLLFGFHTTTYDAIVFISALVPTKRSSNQKQRWKVEELVPTSIYRA